MAVFSFGLFTANKVFAGMLSPGTIYSCGEIIDTGTYTLSSTSTFNYSVGGIGNACFTITSGGDVGDTIIDGNGMTVIGDINGDGTNPGDLSHNFTLQNITVVGTTSSNGAPDDSNNSYPGNGGTIDITNSVTPIIYANGGPDSNNNGMGGSGGTINITNSTVTSTVISSNGSVPSGNGGSIVINGGNVDISNSSISAAGDDVVGNPGGLGLFGKLTINFTNLVHTNSAVSAYLFLNGPGNVGAFGGGILGAVSGSPITDAAHCNIAYPGTYYLGADIVGDCHIAGGQSLDGAGHKITGNIITDDGFSDVTTSVTLQNIKVLGTIDVSGVGNSMNIDNTGVGNWVTITGSNLDLSSTTINAPYGRVILSYTTLNYAGLVMSPLAYFTYSGSGNSQSQTLSYGGGSVVLPGDYISSSSQCNFGLAGTYTLSANIVGDCHVTNSGVTIDGANQYSIIGNVIGDGSASSTAGKNFTLKNIKIIGSISSNGASSTDSNGGKGGIITLSGSTLDLSSTTVSTLGGSGDVMDGYSNGTNGTFNLTYTNIITSASTYFNNIASLIINSVSYGSWNGVFNFLGYYFNDKASGGGNDGNWNNVSNWWTDSTFSVGTGVIPKGFSNVIIDSDITQNTGSSALVNSATFNGTSTNHINITANTITFNDSSRNFGTTTGLTTFVGDNSENLGSVVYDNSVWTARGNNLDQLTYIASSADGTKLAVASGPSGESGNGQQIQISSDSGVTWNSYGPNLLWHGITSSADGTKLAAVAYNSQIYVSSDSGVTWNVSTSSPSTYWRSITSSASSTNPSIDGKYLAAVQSTPTYGGQIYTSSDFGVTWTLSTSTSNVQYYSITSSADGTSLAAVAWGGKIYTSSDSGGTWNVSTSSLSANWYSITSSADGKRLAATQFVSNKHIYVSSDFGLTWTTRGPSNFWTSVKLSADGTKLIATAGGGQVYKSSDSGVTWVALNSGSKSWRSVAFSEDGNKVAATVSNGQVFTSDLTFLNTPIREYVADTTTVRDFSGSKWIVDAVGAVVDLSNALYDTTIDSFEALSGGSFISNPNINNGAQIATEISINSPMSGTNIKWLPSIDWGSSVTCRYSYDNFLTIHSANCSTGGLDIPRPTAGAHTLYIRGINVRNGVSNSSVTFTYDNTQPVWTSCGSDLLDESSRPYYYLQGNVIGDCVFKVSTELRGSSSTDSMGYTVNGNIVATSSGDGLNISLKNITVNGFINANGADGIWSGFYPHTAGFDGGSINISTSTTGYIISNGGVGLVGGNGGIVSLTNSLGNPIDSTITANGGDAAQCGGTGGNGGSILLTNSTYGTTTNNGGRGGQGENCLTGFSGNSSSGSSGSTVISGSYSPQAQSANTSAIPVLVPVKPLDIAPSVVPNLSGGSSGSVISHEVPIVTSEPVISSPVVTKSSFTPGSFVSVAAAAAQKVADTANAFVNSPASKTVQATGFFAGLVASVAFYTDTAFATPIAASEAVFIPARLWGLILMGLGIRRKSRPWGTVYDSVTKQPIDPAYITARDSTGKVVAEAVTDVDGRYAFLLPDGIYYLSVQKTNYEFPSKKLDGKQSDELYNDLYFGEPVTVRGGEVIDKNIPLDQKDFDWNQENKTKVDAQNAPSFHTRYERPVAIASNYIYGLGLIISAVAVAMKPSAFNVMILISYTLILVFLRFSVKSKRLGMVTDTAGNPLSYAIVRITTPDRQVVLRSGVTDAQGHYYCIVPKGQYSLDIQKKNPDGTYSKVYESGVLTNKTGIVNTDFTI